MATVAAVDIGGTQVRAALIEGGGTILRRLAEPVERANDGPSLTAQVAGLVRRLSGEPLALGVSLPAVIDRTAGRVEWAPNLPGWNGVPLGGELSAALGLPVALEYDGHAAVLGEHWAGTGRGVAELAFVIVGTGVGGGFISGGQLVRGFTNLAGAGGWMSVPAPRGWDAQSACQKGFLESLIAGPALQQAAARQLGQALAPRDLFDRASAGDPACRAIVEGALEHLGWALVNVVSLLNPQLVLLGGSVGLRFAGYADRLEAMIRRHAQPWSARAARVAPAGLGDDAGLLGAGRSAVELVKGA
ncbi:MAG: ROK family protein [Bacillota bacterium]